MKSTHYGKLQPSWASGSACVLHVVVEALDLNVLISRSLKNHGADEDVAGMFDMGAETMALPLEEKMKFEQGDDGTSAGFATPDLYARLLLHTCIQIQSGGRKRY